MPLESAMTTSNQRDGQDAGLQDASREYYKLFSTSRCPALAR